MVIRNGFRILTFTFIFCVLFSYGNSKAAGLWKTDAFEGAEMYLTADRIYPVLRLQGSWKEMGRQYGALAGKRLRTFYSEITADVANRGITHQQQLQKAKILLKEYSKALKQLLAGMAETSGLKPDEIEVLNASMMNLTNAVLSGPPSVCSGIAAWDQYTPHGELIFGRNWDINRSVMKRYMKYLSVCVFNPTNGYSFANIHPLGNVYLETGMNAKGIFIELNNGEAQDPTEVEGAEDSSVTLVRVLNKAGTLEEAFNLLKKTQADLSYIIQIADDRRAISAERPTFGIRARHGKYPGLLAAYNSFVEPYPAGWVEKLAPPPKVSMDPRLMNIWTLANSAKFKGHMDLDGMKAFLDVDVTDGGAVHGGTVLQVIAIPHQKTVWIRGLDYSDWQEVVLETLFTKK